MVFINYYTSIVIDIFQPVKKEYFQKLFSDRGYLMTIEKVHHFVLNEKKYRIVIEEMK